MPESDRLAAKPAGRRSTTSPCWISLRRKCTAANTVYRNRAIVFNALEFAVEKELLQKTPIAGAAWTGTAQRRDRRRLKQRARGEVRPVPCPPLLTATLQHHVEPYGVADDGSPLRSPRGQATRSPSCTRSAPKCLTDRNDMALEKIARILDLPAGDDADRE
ncbi:hypothetical protein GCM10022222_59600 [Amycolatopsis ultiminotia]|uniref:Uncharacterized protein n=1 Tax=Amycolatopsis ultiminotia TaxID=543629 RepID=A0ABP6XKC5_9PSEU